MTVEDGPRKLGDSDLVLTWAAEFAGYFAEAAESLRDTASQAEQECCESLESRGVQAWGSSTELEPQEHQLFVRARATGHAGALLSLFAIEVALKAYQIRDMGEYEREHDLRKLFDSLNKTTKARLEELCPGVTETVTKHRNGFVSLRYLFEELGKSKRAEIPKSADPLHGVAKKIAEALREEPEIQESVAAGRTSSRSDG
ncbi:MAG: HEPN domain-containing protein [Gemmatimonadales bacterium]|nr:HEPN domain-containing protein [Gemmatimonadales bacterium]